MCHPCRRKSQRFLDREQAKRDIEAMRAEAVTCPICSEPFVKRVRTQVYCSSSCRDLKRGWSRAKTESRGYGRRHQLARQAMLVQVEAGDVDCCLCGEPIHPNEAWHLDHTPERDGYRGAAHALCNVRDGARRGARNSQQRRLARK